MLTDDTRSQSYSGTKGPSLKTRVWAYKEWSWYSLSLMAVLRSHMAAAARSRPLMARCPAHSALTGDTRSQSYSGTKGLSLKTRVWAYKEWSWYSLSLMAVLRSHMAAAARSWPLMARCPAHSALTRDTWSQSYSGMKVIFSRHQDTSYRARLGYSLSRLESINLHVSAAPRSLPMLQVTPHRPLRSMLVPLDLNEDAAPQIQLPMLNY